MVNNCPRCDRETYFIVNIVVDILNIEQMIGLKIKDLQISDQ